MADDDDNATPQLSEASAIMAPSASEGAAGRDVTGVGGADAIVHRLPAMEDGDELRRRRTLRRPLTCDLAELEGALPPAVVINRRGSVCSDCTGDSTGSATVQGARSGHSASRQRRLRFRSRSSSSDAEEGARGLPPLRLAVRPAPVTPAGRTAAHALAAAAFVAGLAMVAARPHRGGTWAMDALAVLCVAAVARGVFVACSYLFIGLRAIENNRRYMELHAKSPFQLEKAKGRVDDSMVEYLQTNYDSATITVHLEGGHKACGSVAEVATVSSVESVARRRSRAHSIASSCSSLWRSVASTQHLQPKARSYQRRNTHSSCREYMSYASDPVPDVDPETDSSVAEASDIAPMAPVPSVPPAMEGQVSYSRRQDGSRDTIGSGLEDSAKLREFAYKLPDWNFDMFEVAAATPRPLAFIGFVCLDAYSKLVDFDKQKLLRFLREVEGGYRQVPYHNSLHGASVARAVYSFCAGCGLAFTQEFMEFTIVLAGLVHDVHHPGLTPAFLSKASMSGRWKSKISPPLEEADMELAIKYNDNSPLEHMHCAITFSLLRKESSAFLRSEDVATMRKPLIRAILGTDMAKHAETMTRVAALIDNLRHPDESGVPWHWPAKPPANADEEGRKVWERLAQEEFVMELFLHAADIGNPTLPFDQWCRWNRLVQQEFHGQGDREVEEFGELISPPAGFDRAVGPEAEHSFTKGFMQYLALPLFEQLHELSQISCESSVCRGVNISGCVDNLRANIERWGSYRLEADPSPASTPTSGPSADTDAGEEGAAGEEAGAGEEGRGEGDGDAASEAAPPSGPGGERRPGQRPGSDGEAEGT